MHRYSRYVMTVMAVLFLAGCRELPRYFVGEKPVARVGEKELALHDVAQSLPEGLSSADSAAYAKVYVDRWVRKQLKLMEAEQLFSSSVADIDRMVEEYRQSLLIRKLDQFYVDRLVDTTFTEEEIAAYYTEHASDFKLDRTIVKGRVVRVPKGYRQTRRLKELLVAKSEARMQDFRDICLKNEFEMNDYADSWIDYADFLSLLPTVRSQSYTSLLTKQGVQEMVDQHYHYYFFIDAVRRVGDAVPLEQLRSTIRRVLFNQRQQQVVRDHEQALYEQSMATGGIRLYEEESSDADSDTN